MTKFQLLADQWENTGEDDIIVSRGNSKDPQNIENNQLASDVAELAEKINIVFKI